jgi:hypothetical protein
LPVIPPSTQETDESSNWDDLEQDFDPYLGSGDVSTSIERQGASAHGDDQPVSELAVEAEMDQAKPSNGDSD